MIQSDSFSGLKVLIIGDVMVDSYINGRIERISPEAPVPVVTVKNREERLGGAANVALNVLSLGAQPRLCAVVGKDKMGERFLSLMGNARIPVDGILQLQGRPTTVKHRVMSGNHHVLRIDEETEAELRPEEKMRLHSTIDEQLRDANVVIIEDYDKGLLSEETISYIRQQAQRLDKPVVIDPKKKNFHLYTGLTLFKPNLKELQEGINRKIDTTNLDDIRLGVEELFDRMKCEAVMVTLSEKGVMIKTASSFDHIPAHYREISDVSGAGDTVVATAALAWALGLGPKEVASLSNLAGGLVCEHHGVVPVDREQLIVEASKL